MRSGRLEEVEFTRSMIDELTGSEPYPKEQFFSKNEEISKQCLPSSLITLTISLKNSPLYFPSNCTKLQVYAIIPFIPFIIISLTITITIIYIYYYITIISLLIFTFWESASLKGSFCIGPFFFILFIFSQATSFTSFLLFLM